MPSYINLVDFGTMYAVSGLSEFWELSGNRYLVTFQVGDNPYIERIA